MKQERIESVTKQVRNWRPLHDHIAAHRAIKLVGGQREMARRLGLPEAKSTMIKNWVTVGRVPARWVHRVAEVTGIPVTDFIADWENSRHE